MADIKSPVEIKPDPVLDQLAERIRAAHEAVCVAQSNALDHALTAGDLLLAVKARGISLKRWIAKCCVPLGVSTGLLYAQLANHRHEIEVARRENPKFSLREARRLIMKPRNAGSTIATVVAEVDAALVVSSRWSVTEWTAALTALGLEGFLRVCPPSSAMSGYATSLPITTASAHSLRRR
jgi:hypothetical protein